MGKIKEYLEKIKVKKIENVTKTITDTVSTNIESTHISGITQAAEAIVREQDKKQRKKKWRKLLIRLAVIAISIILLAYFPKVGVVVLKNLEIIVQALLLL